MEKPLSNVAKQILSRLIQISGCSFETFTNNEFLEIETLGPMTKLLPGETVEHVAHWALFRNVRVNECDGQGTRRGASSTAPDRRGDELIRVSSVDGLAYAKWTPDVDRAGLRRF